MKHRTLPRYRHSGQLTIAAAGRLFLAAIAMVWDGRDIERIFKLGGVHPTTPDLEHRAILVLKSMQRRRHKAPRPRRLPKRMLRQDPRASPRGIDPAGIDLLFGRCVGAPPCSRMPKSCACRPSPLRLYARR